MKRFAAWLMLLLILLSQSAPIFAADLSVTAGSVVPASDATMENGTAGATITTGQVVYLDSSTNTFKLADADSATSAVRTPYGIALNGASSSQPVRVLKAGGLNPGATVVVGKVYVLSTTAGGIAPVTDLATGTYVSVLGIGTTTSNIQVVVQVSGVAVP